MTSFISSIRSHAVGCLGLAVALGFVGTSARADILIDNFTTTTSTIAQTGTGTTTSPGVTGAGILGTRTLAITVAPPLGSASAGVSGGFSTASFTGVYTPPNGNSNFDLKETFAAANASGFSKVSFVMGSTLGVTVQIIANGTSTYSTTYATNNVGATNLVPFSSFSNPAVFSSLTSLEFIETFPNGGISGPSVSFTGPILLTASVPEPSTFALAGLFGVGAMARFWAARRRKMLILG